MKNKLKVILGTIVGIIIGTSITVYAYNYQAKDIGFKPTNEAWKVDNVEDAINQLYNNTNNKDAINIYASHKEATGWNALGLNFIIKQNEEYMSIKSGIATINKAGNYRVTIMLINSGATSSVAKTELYKNDELVNSFSNSSTAGNASNSKSINLELNESDTLYVRMYGGAGGNPTYYITTLEYLG